MADVMNRIRDGGQKSRDDRGQLILVTGLAVAVTLVALVLLLNTAIYTQNLATRGAEIQDGTAVSFRQEAVEGVGEVVDAENREEYDSRAKLEQNVSEGVVRFDALASRYHAERGTVAQVEEGSLALTDGTLLRQTNASRNFTSADESTDWTLVEDASAGTGPGVRGFALTVSRENLSDSHSSAFTVGVEGDRTWQARIYDDGDAITVAVENGSEPADTVCSVTGPEATVDLTAGTINGTPCPGLVWAKGVSAPYDLTFDRADEATGTYALTVRTPAGETDPDVQSANFAESNDAESPRAIPAIYAAEFEIHFETPNLAFHTTVRTAPGEPA